MTPLDLTLNQLVTLNDMKLAPKFNENQRPHDTFTFDGVVFGSWNKNTVESLEKKGFVDLVPTREGFCVVLA